MEEDAVHLVGNSSLVTEALVKNEFVKEEFDCPEDGVPDPPAVSLKITIKTEEPDEDMNLEADNSIATGFDREVILRGRGHHKQLKEAEREWEKQDWSISCHSETSQEEDGAFDEAGSSEDVNIMQRPNLERLDPSLGGDTREEVKVTVTTEEPDEEMPLEARFGRELILRGQGHYKQLEEAEREWEKQDQSISCHSETSQEDGAFDEAGSSEDLNIMQRSNLECLDLSLGRDTREEGINEIERSSQSALPLKTREKMKSNVKPHKCHCCESFTRKSSLNVYESPSTGEEVLQCSSCETGLPSKWDVKSHVNTNTEESNFQCGYCEKRFKSKQNVTRHERIHTEGKPFQCSYCKKAFRLKHNVKMHEHIHTGERPFKCRYCEKRFTFKGDLTKHERVHTGEMPYQCSYCEKRCTLKPDLTKHERIHTGERPYQCSYCEKRFKQKGRVVIHERIHTGERPYKCNYCEKTFQSKQYVRIHEHIHTGEKPFQCSYCKKAFRSKPNMRVHERIHHTYSREALLT